MGNMNRQWRLRVEVYVRRMRAVDSRSGPDLLVHPGAGQLRVEHRRLLVEDEGVPTGHRRHPRLLPDCSQEEGSGSGGAHAAPVGGRHAAPSPEPAQRQRARDSGQLGRTELEPIDRQLYYCTLHSTMRMASCYLLYLC